MISVMKASQKQAEAFAKKNGGAGGAGADGADNKKGRRQRDEGVAMSDDEIRDEILTIRGAGHETTSNTVSWALLLLAENPAKVSGLQV
jgi:cytochrome P450